MIGNPNQPKDATRAIFAKDPKIDRTHTDGMNYYLEGSICDKNKKYENITLETVHGLKTNIRVPLEPYVRLIEIDDSC